MTPTVAILVDRLEEDFGAAPLPPARTPLELVLWENAAYLADDDRRGMAFDRLRELTGFLPERILAAEDETLREVARFGIVPDQTVGKLRRIAEIALIEFDGAVDDVVKLPSKAALRALRKFPAIGEPAAEKILMMNGVLKVLALESNGLRVLQRIGYAGETGDYARDYKAMRDALGGAIPVDAGELTRAHFLLRRHGQTVCRRSVPECGRCPLAVDCAFRRASTV